MCTETRLSLMCPAHRARHYSYEHTPPRPVVVRVHFTYKPVFYTRRKTPLCLDQFTELNVITVHCQLRWGSGKARTRPPYRAVFCLLSHPDISGDGRHHVVRQMVVDEIKRLGWGWARGVSCRT